jgi:hypothetical protein
MTAHDQRWMPNRTLAHLLAVGTLALAAGHAAAAPTVACKINAPTGAFLVSDTYEYRDRRSDVCFNAGLLVFSGSSVNLSGRTRCTDDPLGSHTTDYELPGTFTFDKSRCAASLTLAEGETLILMRLFFDKTGNRFRGSYFDDRGVGGIVGERQ